MVPTDNLDLPVAVQEKPFETKALCPLGGLCALANWTSIWDRRQPHRFLAASYALMGQNDEAREVVARLRSITPDVIAGAAQFRRAEDRELPLCGLRLAAAEPIPASL